MHYDEKHLKIAKELHEHSWLSEYPWDTLKEAIKEEYIAKAISGKMYKDDTKDRYIPEGMEIKPYPPSPAFDYKKLKREKTNMDKLLEESGKPCEQVLKEGPLILITESSGIGETVFKKKRGRPPGSKNKK